MIEVRRWQYKDTHCAEIFKDGRPVKIGKCCAVVTNKEPERLERDIQRMIERVQNERF